MKPNLRKCFVAVALVSLVAGLGILPFRLGAQPPSIPSSTTPDAQRNALSNLRARVGWLQNATRTAGNFTDGVGLVWQQFQYLRASYEGFTATLNPQQHANGANELAELSAGLDILQESFANYQNDVAGGRSSDAALAELCQVLRQASGVWLQELNKDSARLGLGR